jgi:hypothetical protein
MAMNGDSMAAEIVAAMATLTNEEKLDQTKVMKKMCGAIVAHITNNAVVSGTGAYITGSLTAGATPVTNASGPPTTNNSGTIT